MRIAILGATSQIAKDLVLSFSAHRNHDLALFARRPDVVMQWLARVGSRGRYAVADFDAFRLDEDFGAILNFVGVADPAQAALMGASIFDVTLKYDDIALGYLHHHPDCRYLFLSSGAAYGSRFNEPVNENSRAMIAINNLAPQDWYAVAKLHAECRHRSLSHLPIVDIRVFNYFSRTQNMSARFFITDIVRAIQSGNILFTTLENITRDYLHPADFHQLISLLLLGEPKNKAVDCYSKLPIAKMDLLAAMKRHFGLQFEISNIDVVCPTGTKLNYYSRNKIAEYFGYFPSRTSLDGILEELGAILGDVKRRAAIGMIAAFSVTDVKNPDIHPVQG